MNKKCLICQRIKLIKKDSNPFFVLELETGYVVIGDYQLFKGYTLFLCKIHTSELHKLPRAFRVNYLKEMSLVAEAVYKAFKPRKLNYELLGNSEEHLHWHIFPRYKNGPANGKPVWSLSKKIRYADKHKPSENEIKELKETLKAEINRLVN